MKARVISSVAAISLLLSTHIALAQEAVGAAEELAKELQNPVASLISVPFQSNYDGEIGPARGGRRFTVNIQPVIPFSLSPEWNIISRTILPVVTQTNIAPGLGTQTGLSDTVQSLFLSPAKLGPAGIIWGIGPVLLLPTGTNDLLSLRQWGAGPTAVVLKQMGGWTFGMLANHIWSYADAKFGAQDVSATFLQPFISYTTPDAWTFTVNTETTHDWRANAWIVPINTIISKLIKVGNQPISINAGLRYYAASPSSGPHGFGGRLVLVFLFPK